ncbi:MAG: PEP-CTERM sorting domain-containing protein [Planctomycetes bacterium]|nr:PEP-CTERM sorting domain-containing protein [Planctomycetota bacterium]
MILASLVCMLSAGAAHAAPLERAILLDCATHAVAVPQGQDDTGSGKGGQSNPPSGGTPEPASLLLLAGGALGYGAVRRLRKRNGKPDSAASR